MGKNISALANSAALAEKSQGYLVWGVCDKDHEIVGTGFKPETSYVKKDALDHWLSQRLKPDIGFEFASQAIDSRTVVMLQIPTATTVPVRFDGEAYVRVGPHTRRLRDFSEKERMLWRVLGSRIFEREVAVEQVTDEKVLELLDYEAYFDLMTIPQPETRTCILESLEQERIIRRRDDEAWDVLNLGFLTFARDLADSCRLRSKSLRIVRYKETGRLAGEEEVEISEGYAASFSKVVRELDCMIPQQGQLRGGIRMSAPCFPSLAVREIVANMLMHQDFTEVGNGPLIEIFSNRLEASNPGKPLVDVNRFVDHPPQSRNKEVASLLRRLGICEERGSGWDKIVASIEELQLPAPRIEVVGSNTRVTLFAAKPLAELDSGERTLAVYLVLARKYSF